MQAWYFGYLSKYKMLYRSDLDGLRAIGVLAIFIFHLDIGLLPGGFVGVDIFFVISGYLISKNIYEDIGSGVFSISHFYERRAHRILPALISVMAATSIAAYFLLYPIELVSYAKSVIASALFSSNIYFNFALDYFSPSADQIPLLHLWSLGVEEQFYIFLPFILISISKFSKRLIPVSVLILLAISLFFSQKILLNNPQLSFYMLPFRAFELLIGSLIALPFFNVKKDRSYYVSAFVVGVGLLIYSIFFYSNKTSFPGLSALLPCLGAAFVIFSGQRNSGFPGLILSAKPLVFIGKISYSLYLVHWPLIVFGKRVFPNVDKFYFAFLIFVVSIFFAWVNYNFVEQIFRFNKLKMKSKWQLTSAILPLCFFVVVASYTVQKNGFQTSLPQKIEQVFEQNPPQLNVESQNNGVMIDQNMAKSDLKKSRNFEIVKSPEVSLKSQVPDQSTANIVTATVTVAVDPPTLQSRIDQVLAVTAYNPSKDYRSGECFLNPDQDVATADLNFCLPTGSGKKAIIWGDSHAAHLYMGLKKTLADYNISLGQLTASACPPILGIDISVRPYCKDANTIFIRKIAEVQPDLLIITASWPTIPEYLNSFDLTLDEVEKLNIKNVIVIGEGPWFKRSVPMIMVERLKNDSTNFDAIDDLENLKITKSDNAIGKIISARKDMVYISLFKTLCPKGLCPMASQDGKPLIFDVVHLTPEGSAFYSKEITPQISRVMRLSK